MKTNSIRLRVLAVAVASILVTIAVAGGSLVILFEERVAVHVDAEPFVCDVEAAVSLGLIANELIAASFSYIIGSGATESEAARRRGPRSASGRWSGIACSS